jgi:hypothetical protein
MQASPLLDLQGYMLSALLLPAFVQEVLKEKMAKAVKAFYF